MQIPKILVVEKINNQQELVLLLLCCIDQGSVGIKWNVSSTHFSEFIIMGLFIFGKRKHRRNIGAV